VRFTGIKQKPICGLLLFARVVSNLRWLPYIFRTADQLLHSVSEINEHETIRPHQQRDATANAYCDNGKNLEVIEAGRRT